MASCDSLSQTSELVHALSSRARKRSRRVTALSEADIAAIRAAIDEDAAAVRRADWDAVVRMFTDDAIRFPPHLTDRGNYMGLLRKQPDSSWLWTTDMISSELPAAQ